MCQIARCGKKITSQSEKYLIKRERIVGILVK